MAQWALRSVILSAASKFLSADRSVVEAGCAEDGAAAEGKAEGIEHDRRKYHKGSESIGCVAGGRIECSRQNIQKHEIGVENNCRQKSEIRDANLAARGESTIGRAHWFCGQGQGARRRLMLRNASVAGDIVDDEQRRDCPQNQRAPWVPAPQGDVPRRPSPAG
jgi:hypothetical protein